VSPSRPEPDQDFGGGAALARIKHLHLIPSSDAYPILDVAWDVDVSLRCGSTFVMPRTVAVFTGHFRFCAGRFLEAELLRGIKPHPQSSPVHSFSPPMLRNQSRFFKSFTPFLSFVIPSIPPIILSYPFVAPPAPFLCDPVLPLDLGLSVSFGGPRWSLSGPFLVQRSNFLLSLEEEWSIFVFP